MLILALFLDTVLSEGEMAYHPQMSGIHYMMIIDHLQNKVSEADQVRFME